eukprot:TsM_000207600 transcript=TsM_000207600 gene=TsM_000207600
MGNFCARCCGHESNESDMNLRHKGSSKTYLYEVHIIPVLSTLTLTERPRFFPRNLAELKRDEGHHFCALTSNETLLQPEGDVTDMMSSILKVVETQVVDAGVTDVNFLEQQDYDARAEYYAAQFSQKSDLPDSVFVVMAASGNPSTILADQLLRQPEINEIQSLANRIAKLIEAMFPQVTESFVVHLDPV